MFIQCGHAFIFLSKVRKINTQHTKHIEISYNIIICKFDNKNQPYHCDQSGTFSLIFFKVVGIIIVNDDVILKSFQIIFKMKQILKILSTMFYACFSNFYIH